MRSALSMPEEGSNRINRSHRKGSGSSGRSFWQRYQNELSDRREGVLELPRFELSFGGWLWGILYPFQKEFTIHLRALARMRRCRPLERVLECWLESPRFYLR